MRPIIHSDKKYIQVTFSSATTLARNLETIATSVESTVANQPTEVPEGANIRSVYCEMWILGSTQDAFATAMVEKGPSGHPGATFTEMTNLSTYDNKKNILWTFQGLAPNESGANPVPIIREWLKIPKGKQRMGLGDKLRFSIASRGVGDINYCGFFLFKALT